MLRRCLPTFSAFLLATALWSGSAQPAQAQYPSQQVQYWVPRFTHYPYYYFPHNYWPTMSPQWPEPTGMPYQRPPAYMAYPPFKEPQWRYDLWKPHLYYSGFHFWLDQF